MLDILDTAGQEEFAVNFTFFLFSSFKSTTIYSL